MFTVSVVVLPATDTIGTRIRARGQGRQITRGWDHASNDPAGDVARELASDIAGKEMTEAKREWTRANRRFTFLP